MAAAEQEARPAEAAVSSIVSTPLGKMAKASSPTKKPPLAGGQQLQHSTPSGSSLHNGSSTVAYLYSFG